ncbi:transcriptional factor B3 family protein [Actinidia rufa]|uniref:Auxin-responsive protein n=1 Tax=Actinidia rufa TaxID=165716 RepID=A0A7J0EIL1_9ERIC|nr:transcriptional factor B3 family protein [Actinidia rufa]
MGESDKEAFVRVPESLNGDFSYPLISSPWSEQLIKMLIKPQSVNNPATVTPVQDSSGKGALSQQARTLTQTIMKQKPEITLSESENHPQNHLDQPNSVKTSLSQQTELPRTLYKFRTNWETIPRFAANTEVSKGEQVVAVDQVSQLTSNVGSEDKLVNQLAFINQNHCLSQLQTNPWLTQSQLDSLIVHPQQLDAHQLESPNFNGLLPFSDTNNWNMNQATYQSLTGILRQNQLVPLPQQDLYSLQCRSNSNGLRDLSEDIHNQSDIYRCLNFDSSNAGSTVVDPSVSSTILDEFCQSKDPAFQNPSDYLVGNFSSSQDVQSQITSASLAVSRAFPLKEFPDSSGGASSSNVDFDDSSLLQNSTWQQAVPPVRTYTKIQKSGSVGRSIDVSSFKNYEELLSAIECMFGLEGLLNDRSSGWKLVYVDFENDVLLVGDDPWEEFISCVRCIRILSPSEVQKMSEEGMQLLNTTTIPGTNGSITESDCAWDGPN